MRKHALAMTARKRHPHAARRGCLLSVLCLLCRLRSPVTGGEVDQRRQIFIVRHQGWAGVLVIVRISRFLLVSFGGSIVACNKAPAMRSCTDNNLIDNLG